MPRRSSWSAIQSSLLDRRSQRCTGVAQVAPGEAGLETAGDAVAAGDPDTTGDEVGASVTDGCGVRLGTGDGETLGTGDGVGSGDGVGVRNPPRPNRNP